MALTAGSPRSAIDGAVLRPLEPAGIANVLFFVATDCPVSNSYAPEIQRICAAYASKGIACSLDLRGPGVTATAVAQASRRVSLPGDRRRDRSRRIARRAGAGDDHAARRSSSIGAATVRYRGRIDNFYAALGRPRQVVTARDLQDALNAVAGGKPVARPETEAVGCYIVPSNLRRNS